MTTRELVDCAKSQRVSGRRKRKHFIVCSNLCSNNGSSFTMNFCVQLDQVERKEERIIFREILTSILDSRNQLHLLIFNILNCLINQFFCCELHIFWFEKNSMETKKILELLTNENVFRIKIANEVNLVRMKFPTTELCGGELSKLHGNPLNWSSLQIFYYVYA